MPLTDQQLLAACRQAAEAIASSIQAIERWNTSLAAGETGKIVETLRVAVNHLNEIEKSIEAGQPPATPKK